MQSKNYGTIERYRELAFAVITLAVKDYYNGSAYAIYKIDKMWFEITGIDRDWFIKTVEEEAKIRYAKRFCKN